MSSYALEILADCHDRAGFTSGLESVDPRTVGADAENPAQRLRFLPISLLPDHEKPDKSGWKRLADLPVVVLDGDGKFRKFLTDCEREHGVLLKIGAECTSYPQAVELAEVAGCAVFVPEYWWRRRKEWVARTQNLPGLERHRRTFQLGWNRKVVERRPEVAALVKALGGKR